MLTSPTWGHIRNRKATLRLGRSLCRTCGPLRNAVLSIAPLSRYVFYGACQCAAGAHDQCATTQKVITDMKARQKDPDLARLFENTFPNTLDTTVKYFNAVRTGVLKTPEI